MKHFITCISLQENDPERGRVYLGNVVYEPGETAYAYEYATSYPIVPVVASAVEDGETVKLTCVRFTSDEAAPKADEASKNAARNEWVARNRQKLLDDIEAIRKNLGKDFKVDLRPDIGTPYAATPADLDAYTEVIQSCVDAGDEVYACMTLGEKSQTLALYRALNRIQTDAENSEGAAKIVDVVYGQLLKHDAGNNAQGKLFSLGGFVLRTLADKKPEGSSRDDLGDAGDTDVGASSEGAEATGAGNASEAVPMPPVAAKTKHFFTGISLARGERFKPNQYFDETGTQKLYEPVRFPIVPYIAALAGNEETIKVTRILVGDETMADTMAENVAHLEEEVTSALAWGGRDTHVDYDDIVAPPDRSPAALVGLCEDIEAAIGDDEVVYACFTFGEKGMTIALQQALAEAMLGHAYTTDVGGCVYGAWNRDTGINKLRDVTPFVISTATELLMRRDKMGNTSAVRTVVLGEEAGE